MRRSVAYDRRAPRRRTVGWLARIGRSGIDWYLFWLGAVRALMAALTSAFLPGRAAAAEVRRITFQQIFFTGVQGLTFITAAAVVSGATMMIQTAAAAPGLPGEVMGQVLVAVVLRELAPLSTATIVASRSGTAIATELGNMRASLEVHALSSMGIDPPRFVTLPRIIGVVVSVPAHRVGIGEPAKESRDLVLGLRPSHKVPMGGHHAIGKDWQPFPSK